MLVCLINIDEMYGKKKVPNYALKKIEMHHSMQGDTIAYNDNIACVFADKIYVSCIFSWNKQYCERYEKYPNVVIGGSGYDIMVKLPEEIENLRPRVNFGFLTRGCIRNCPWCIVPKKDGKIRKIATISELWDRVAHKVVLLDDNILALPEYFKEICQEALDLNVILDFHALDIRLLNEEIASWLGKIRHAEYNFAYDEPAHKNMVDRGITMLKKAGVRRSCFFVLVGFDTTYEEDLYRCLYLKHRYQNAFVMRFNKKWDKFLIGLSMWVNQKHLFQAQDFPKFLEYPQYASYKKVIEDYFIEKGTTLAAWYEKTKEEIKIECEGKI